MARLESVYTHIGHQRPVYANPRIGFGAFRFEAEDGVEVEYSTSSQILIREGLGDWKPAPSNSIPHATAIRANVKALPHGYTVVKAEVV